MRFYHGIRFKVILGVLLILGVILIFVNYLVLIQHKQLLLEGLIKRGDHLSSLVASTSVAPLLNYQFYILQEIAIQVEASPEIAFCEIYDAQGISLTTDEATFEGQPIIKKKRQIGENIRLVETSIVFNDETLGKVEIGLYLDQVNDQIRARTIQFIIVLLVILGLSAFLIYTFLSYFFIFPLINLSKASEALAQDQIVELDIHRKDELGFLAKHFVEMRDAIRMKIDEVRESEIRLRQVIDLVPHNIYAKDKTGKFILVNRTQAEFFEMTVDELVGKNIAEIYPHEDEVVYFSEDDMEVIETGQIKVTPEVSLADPQGQIHVFQVQKMPFNISGIKTALGVSVDITKQKQAQSELQYLNEELEQRVKERTQELLNTQNQIKEREENLNRIIETIPLPLAISSSSDGKFLRVNQAFLDFHKLSKDELPQFSIASAYVNPEDRTKLLEAFGEQRGLKNYEVLFKRLGTGEKYWCFASLYPIIYFGESSILGLSIDITERKQLETELINARHEAETANQTKSEFLANMSHEIRTPMNAILGFSQILEKQLTDKEHRESVQNILSSGKSLLTLINDILDLSKVEAGKLELEYTAFNPHTLFEEMKLIFSLKMAEKKLEFQVEIDSDLPQALILDEVRLRQILLNLIGNAVKFTETGTIKLSVSQLYTKEDHSQLNLIFSVEDTGMGIPKDQIESIFAPFEQQKKQSHVQYGGTGLGLTITKRLVEMMGGHISVESQVGVGSQFKITLKEVTVSSVVDLKEPQKTAIDVDLIQFEHASILIVDDIETNRNLVKGYLASYDFNFYEAANGEEAVELAKRYLPDLILMDIKMPVLDGEEATKQLKTDEETKAIPVIALTAAGMKQAEDGFLRICDGFLRKPINRTQLIRLSAAFLKHTFKEVKAESYQDEKLNLTPAEMGENEKTEERFAPKAEALSDIPLIALDLDTLDAVQLDAARLEKLSELLTLLKGELNTVQQLHQVMIVEDIKIFATQVQEWGNTYHYPPLKKWGSGLHIQAAQFDIKTIRKILNQFPEIIESIQSLLGSLPSVDDSFE